MRVKEITLPKNKSVDELIELIKLANTFESDIHFKSDRFTIDAKSLMGVITLIRAGVEMTLMTRGTDEEEALREISGLLLQKNNLVK